MNIEINQKVDNTYQGVYPSTEAHLISYDNSASGLNATNVYDALIEIYTTYGKQTTTYTKPTMAYEKSRLQQCVSEGVYNNIRIPTTAAQVPCYSPRTGGFGNLQNVIDDMIPDNYLCFTAEWVPARISMVITGTPVNTINLEYNTGSGWVEFIPGVTSVTLNNIGDKVYFRGINETINKTPLGHGFYSFDMTGKIGASGNLMSLLDGHGKNKRFAITIPFCFYYLFVDCGSLTSAPELSATTISNYCYYGLFTRCDNLIDAPKLPATTLGQFCYGRMFQECTALTRMPKLLVTGELPLYAYDNMFNECTSLKIYSASGSGHTYSSAIGGTGTVSNMFKNTIGDYSSGATINLPLTVYTQNEPV